MISIIIFPLLPPPPPTWQTLIHVLYPLCYILLKIMVLIFFCFEVTMLRQQTKVSVGLIHTALPDGGGRLSHFKWTGPVGRWIRPIRTWCRQWRPNWMTHPRPFSSFLLSIEQPNWRRCAAGLRGSELRHFFWQASTNASAFPVAGQRPRRWPATGNALDRPLVFCSVIDSSQPAPLWRRQPVVALWTEPPSQCLLTNTVWLTVCQLRRESSI